jgi:hypothetical protein
MRQAILPNVHLLEKIMRMWGKIGKALGYEDCDIEAQRQGIFLRSMNGYCLCAECAKMTDEEIEARLGRSVYDEPEWFVSDEWMDWNDEQWARQIAEAQSMKKVSAKIRA